MRISILSPGELREVVERRANSIYRDHDADIVGAVARWALEELQAYARQGSEIEISARLYLEAFEVPTTVCGTPEGDERPAQDGMNRADADDKAARLADFDATSHMHTNAEVAETNAAIRHVRQLLGRS